MNTQAARHSVSVAGVITDKDGRVLLIRRCDNHRWEPPGGVLELAESIHHGLRREVRVKQDSTSNQSPSHASTRT
jgi:ADP-ribose pyrophosphatase YjhB (NUDIX family)